MKNFRNRAKGGGGGGNGVNRGRRNGMEKPIFNGNKRRWNRMVVNSSTPVVAFTTTGVELFTVVNVNFVVKTLRATGGSQVILCIVGPINIKRQ